MYTNVIIHLQKFAILLNCFWSGHERNDQFGLSEMILAFV